MEGEVEEIFLIGRLYLCFEEGITIVRRSIAQTCLK